MKAVVHSGSGRFVSLVQEGIVAALGYQLVDAPVFEGLSTDYVWQDDEWVLDPPPSDITALEAMYRHSRDRLLQASDWTQLPDVPLDTKAAWATYRQALRDITDQPGWPTDITWPEPPA